MQWDWAGFQVGFLEDSMSFVWAVHENGYEWQRVGRLHLVARREVGSQRLYEPNKDFPCLYRTFGELEESEDVVLEFANRFGSIFYRDIRHAAPYETFVDWKNQIRAMRRTLDIWDRARASEPERSLLIELVDAIKAQLTTFSCFNSMARLRGGKRGTKVIGEQQPQVLVNLDIAEEANRITLEHEPFSLIHALWMQLAHVVAGQKDHRRCPTCSGWFEVSPDRRRADARFCRELCRIAAYKQRVKTAERLYGEGKTIPQIARELGVSKEKAAIWIGMSPQDAAARYGSL